MSDKPDTLEQAIEDLLNGLGVQGAERDHKRQLLLGLAENLESGSDKAEWREYALLQVLQGKPVTSWEVWRKRTPLGELLRRRFPDMTDEEVLELADIS